MKFLRHWFGMFKFWLRVRRMNKALLAQSQEVQPMYDPPTREEVKEEITKAKAQGVRFNHMVTSIARSKEYTNI